MTAEGEVELAGLEMVSDRVRPVHRGRGLANTRRASDYQQGGGDAGFSAIKQAGQVAPFPNSAHPVGEAARRRSRQGSCRLGRRECLTGTQLQLTVQYGFVQSAYFGARVDAELTGEPLAEAMERDECVRLAAELK